MNRIKTLLIISIVIAFSVSMIGCGMLGSGSTTADVTSGAEGDLPEWLMLSHRAEAVEEPEVEEEEAPEEEFEPEEEAVAEAPPAEQPAQPSQPAQPAQPAQPTQTSGTPRYLQPGTMEYIAKMKLDEAVERYKRLIIQLSNEKDKDEQTKIKAEMTALKKNIDQVAAELGVDLQKEYGLTDTSTSTSGSDSGWFNDW
jgi:hypothetical protein